MPNNLSFSELNTQFGQNIFTVVDGKVMLDISLLTGDEVTSLNQQSIVETAYKFLKICYETQQVINGANTTNILKSFSPPFFTTVRQDPPFGIDGSYTITARIPLNTDDLLGTN